MACCTVVIFSASSSGISVSNSSSSAITSSTVSSESAPRSSTNEDSFLISASFTPSCSATIFLTRCSTLSMPYPPRRQQNLRKRCNFTRSRQPARPASLDVFAALEVLRHVHAAVDMERGPRDVTSFVRRKEDHGVRDVIRRAKATERDPLDQFLTLRLAEC